MIYFSDFSVASGPTSDVMFAVQDIATGSSTGATSYTSSTISGLTPAATLFVGSPHAIANDPGETAHASISIGAVVGSTQRGIYTLSEDNVASTNDVRGTFTGRAIEVQSSPGVQSELATATNVSGGVSLNYSSNDATDRRLMAVSFAGTGTSSHVGTISLGTGTGAISVSGVGFQPDVVIFFSANDTTGTGSALFQYTYGFATSDGTQRAVAGVEADAVASGSPRQHIHTDCGASSNNNAGGSTKIVVGGFNSDGFTVTPSASQGNDVLFYLALKFTGSQAKIVDFTTPTATGAATITGAGFTPRFAMAVLTNLEAVNSVAGSTSDLQSGLAISFIGDEQWATSWRIDSGADPTDTGSQCSNVALMGASATDCDAIKATFTAWTSDGVTLNYSAVQGTGKKGFILFVE